MSLPQTTVRSLAQAHAGLLLDAYGVLVDGAGPLPGAVELVRELNATNGNYWVLTNDASKHPDTSTPKYRAMGLELPPERIITSGSLLSRHFAEQGLRGKTCIVLGPADTERYVREAGGEVVPKTADDAEVVVVGDEEGFDFVSTLDHVMTVILNRIDRFDDVALVLPNPDLIYPAGPGRYGMAAGSIASILEQAIEVRFPGVEPKGFARLGKPFAPIFEEAARRAGTRDLVMVGDQLQTDIRGARGFGIPAGLATWGLVGAVPEDLPEALRPTCLVTGF